MKVVVQYNKNFTQQELNPAYAKPNQEQDEISNILYTGKGGTPSMNLKNKTIPPIDPSLVASELQIEKTNTNNQLKISGQLQYLKSKLDFEGEFTRDIIEIRAPFRVNLVYSFLEQNIFSPRISIHEHPFGYSSIDIPSGGISNITLIVIYRDNQIYNWYGSLKENKIFCKYTQPGDILYFPLYNFKLKVINVESINDGSGEVGKKYTLETLDLNPLPFNINNAAKVVNISKEKLLLSEYSFIRLYNNIIPISPFRFMWVNIDDQDLFLNSSFNLNIPVYEEYKARYNNEYQQPIDLISYNKVAFYSENINQQNYETNFQDYALNSNVNYGDVILNLTSTAGLEPGDYLTITYYDLTNYHEEFVKVKYVISSTEIAVERAQLGSSQIFATPAATVKKSRSEYFWLSFISDELTKFEFFWYDTVFMKVEYL